MSHPISFHDIFPIIKGVLEDFINKKTRNLAEYKALDVLKENQVLIRHEFIYDKN